MKKLVIITIILLLFPGCIKKEELKVELPFSEFPDKYTCKGEDISPQIKITGISSKAKTIAIKVYDVDAHDFVHWLIWNIEAKEEVVIPENIPKEEIVEKPIEAIQGRNDFGKIGYSGPCPPPDKSHRYYFRVYILDTSLDLPAGADWKRFDEAISGHVIQEGYAIASYSIKLTPN